MTSQAKVKATPLQLRRTGYLVAASALFVALYSVYAEIDYASFSSDAKRVDARIVRIEAIRSGKRLRHVLHYELELGGKKHAFADRGGKDTKLEELYTGSFNAFTTDDPPLAQGKTLGLLVNPDDASDHRPDREKLPDPQFLWIRTLLALLFLSGVAGFLLWAGHEPKLPEHASSPSSRPPGRTRTSKVSSSRENGVMRLRVSVDVPWPGTSSNNVAQARLRERMLELKSELSEEQGGAPVAVERVASVELKLELNPLEDAQLSEARVEFFGASGERASEAFARAVELHASATKKISSTLSVPSSAAKLRIVLTLIDQSTWEHEVAL